MSVYEERRARSGWGADVTPDFLAAFKAGKLVPVSRMNEGFMRPTYPAQVIHSYYEASLVCELIERDFGPRALTDMLRAYKDGLTTEQVFQRVLHVEPTGLDKRFEDYVKQRFASGLAVVHLTEREGRQGGPPRTSDDGEFASAMREAIGAFEGGKKAESEPLFEKAKKLFPEYAGPQSAYWYLAQIRKARGDLKGAAEELKVIVARNESSDAAHRDLATILLQLGDSAGALQTLDRLMYLAPFDMPSHERLAVLAARAGDRPRAVRERRAVLAMGPVDAAEARYQLALAYFEAGDTTNARRELLRALEDAPNFEKAQQLLLKLRSGSAGGGGVH
jgi:tetratricopeptide (TPR) repeat protein